MVFHPKDDGVTHINIYSKGATQLGRDLSNFAAMSFVHPEFGYFRSVEGFWYFLKTGCKHEEFRTTTGFKAKQLGKTLERVECPGFNQHVLEAIRCKLRQNVCLRIALTASTLPFAHYYYYGDIDDPHVIDLPQYDWIVDEITRIRDVCKEYYK